MTNRGLAQRAKQAREAHEDLHAAFAWVVDPNDRDDPRTKCWLAAVERFRISLDRVLPTALREVDDGRRAISELHVEEIVEFLETDPLFFRSGYIKERLLREIKKRLLDRSQTRRLQDIVLHIARTRDCREYRHYCHAAAAVDDVRLRSELAQLRSSDDLAVRRRALWMVQVMDQAKRIGRAGSAS
ncbi:MAG: hypothetical protein V4610_00170 [Pseudomonadota bacterium]